jgi:hypothetical protein
MQLCVTVFLSSTKGTDTSQWRRHNCSRGMRAVEKAHAISTKTGTIPDEGSKCTSWKWILATSIIAECTSFSGRSSSACIARANTKRHPWVMWYHAAIDGDVNLEKSTSQDVSYIILSPFFLKKKMTHYGEFLCKFIFTLYRLVCLSQWPRCLRRGSAAAHLLGLQPRIPLGVWRSVCCDSFVLLGRRLCVGLITRPEESYRAWCVLTECDREASIMRSSWPTRGCCSFKTQRSLSSLIH